MWRSVPQMPAWVTATSTIAGADLWNGRVGLEPEAGFVFEFADGEHGGDFRFWI